MRGTSSSTLGAATDRIETVLGGPEAERLGEELLSVSRVLDSSAGLRRALTDPSRGGEDKAALVQRLLGSQMSGTTVDVVSGLARGRWSSGRDLADACEELGVLATVGAAEQAGTLEELEDELFRFGRIVDGDPALTAAFSDRAVAPERKTALVDRLLSGKVSPQALLLARTAAAYPRGRRLPAVLADIGEAVAHRRNRAVARVTSAVPLTEAQRSRLTAALGRVYGRSMHLNVDVDPQVVGGLRVQVGDEVMDASVVTRLAEARRRLGG
jgi:F-type H+-transporting ATPase subunit delta